ncbi:MAG: hypothetical protein JWR02_116 [Mucilaginibacter sp.]|nr:hypothetical protein [Mucilaginibacter sp.]
MKQKEVINKIGGIIKELNEQYEYLQGMEENLNSLELELFVSNARFLTNHIEILCKLNSQNSGNKLPSPGQEKNPEQKHFEPVFHQPEHTGENDHATGAEKAATAQPEEQPVPHIDLGTAAVDDSYSYTRQEPETIRHELVLDESMNWDDDEDLPEEEKLPLPAKKAKAETTAPPKAEGAKPEEKNPVQAAGKPQAKDTSAAANEDVLTINQKISSQLKEKPQARAEQSNTAAISDIKQAINLNDKMLYVKDLFNGYSLAYSEAIEILNRFSTFDEATRFLNANYALKNHWESKPETREKFYALLKRRYA